MTAGRDRSIVSALGEWFDASARALPWRDPERRTPYAVWVSEIMLQQTRVETVVPYYERFLSRFPDVAALAGAEMDDVLHLWSGLGYYRRARQLHAAARAVVERHGGAFPGDGPGLRALPGVGAYTAGAIASIAYGRREPLVDGNVARVLARIEAIDEPIKSAAATRLLWAAAARLVPEDRPGRFNEALMELGATVCAPRDPACARCPVSGHCLARRAGRERDLPVTVAKAAVPVVEAVAVVRFDHAARILFARRREGGLFGGLWEPPMVEGTASIDGARGAFAAMGVPLGRKRPLEVGRVTRVLSHRRMVVAVAVAFGGAIRAELGPPYERAAWLDPDAPGVGVSTLAKQVVALARRARAAEND